jgi:hypothetical protein
LVFGRFLGLGEEVDLLGNDLAAIVVGAILVGPFGVVDLPRAGLHARCEIKGCLSVSS